MNPSSLYQMKFIRNPKSSPSILAALALCSFTGVISNALALHIHGYHWVYLAGLIVTILGVIIGVWTSYQLTLRKRSLVLYRGYVEYVGQTLSRIELRYGNAFFVTTKMHRYYAVRLDFGTFITWSEDRGMVDGEISKVVRTVGFFPHAPDGFIITKNVPQYVPVTDPYLMYCASAQVSELATPDIYKSVAYEEVELLTFDELLALYNEMMLSQLGRMNVAP